MGSLNLEKIVPFPFPITDVTGIVPFSYRDGMTYLKMLEGLRKYLNEYIVPEFNDKMDEIVDQFLEGLTNAENTVIQTKKEWRELFDAFMANFDAELQKLNDAGVSRLVRDHESLTWGAMDDEFISEARGHHIWNLKQFKGTNDAERLNRATAFLAALTQDSVLNISEPLNLTETFFPNIAKVSYDFNGNTITCEGLKCDIAVKFVNTAPGLEALNRRFFKNFRLIGPGKGVIGSIGMRFHTDDATQNQNIRGLVIENAEIMKFDVGMSFGRNSYLITFMNGHSYESGTLVRIEDKNWPNGTGNNRNYGENYRFFGWGFGSSQLGVYMGTNDLTDINMFGCSFDFLQGGGQKLCEVYSGQLHLVGTHIEFNGALTGPIITCGPTYSALVSVDGGRIQHNNVPAANVNHYFESTNVYWGGGIRLNNVQMHYLFTNSGFLCTGPGQFSTSNLSFPSGTEGSGFAMGNVLTSLTNNELHDGSFAEVNNIDAIVTIGTGFVSPTESAQVKVINRNGKMVFQKKDTGTPCQIVFTIPVTHGKYYASGLNLSKVSGEPMDMGSMRQNERFAAIRHIDTRGVYTTLRTKSRGDTEWTVKSLTESPKIFGPAYEGPGKKGWNRQAPSWATHYQVTVTLNTMAIGEYEFDMFVMTGA